MHHCCHEGHLDIIKVLQSHDGATLDAVLEVIIMMVSQNGVISTYMHAEWIHLTDVCLHIGSGTCGHCTVFAGTEAIITRHAEPGI